MMPLEPQFDKNQQAEQAQTFTYRVYDCVPLAGSTDVMVTGRLTGKIGQGDAIYLTNYGQDNSPVHQTRVTALEVQGYPVTLMADGLVGLRVENGQAVDIRPTTIGYGSQASEEAIAQAYSGAIGDVYVSQSGFDLTDQDLAGLSLTDAAELWRLANWWFGQQEQTEQALANHHRRLNRLGRRLVDLVLGATELYTIVNQKTGEPHLFSRTVERDGGYECLPPEIALVTEPEHARQSAQLLGLPLKMERISRKMIDFLGDQFYRNGACGVTINSQAVGITASELVPEPDWTGVPAHTIPVTNPAVCRWFLLLAQMAGDQEGQSDLIRGLYQQFLYQALKTARLLQPVKGPLSLDQQGDHGQLAVTKDSQLTFSVAKGRQGRDALYLFTDWKQLRQHYDADWSGLVVTVDSLIDRFDVWLNVSHTEPQLGIYIDQKSWGEDGK